MAILVPVRKIRDRFSKFKLSPDQLMLEGKFLLMQLVDLTIYKIWAENSEMK